MKKVFLMQFDYFDDRDGVTESFGTDFDEMEDVTSQAIRVRDELDLTKGTAVLMQLLESDLITGGQLMALATLALRHVLSLRQTGDGMQDFQDFLRRMIEEGR